MSQQHSCINFFKFFVSLCVSGLSMAVHHDALYSGLSGFNGALGCMAVGGLFFAFSWKTHLFAVASGDNNTQTLVHRDIFLCSNGR